MGRLDLSGAAFTTLGLGNGSAAQGLLMVSCQEGQQEQSSKCTRVTWIGHPRGKRARLDLQHFSTPSLAAGNVADWLDSTDMTGFTFERTLKDDGSVGGLLNDWAAQDIVAWLAKDGRCESGAAQPFYPDIYERISRLLTSVGRKAEADEVSTAYWNCELKRSGLQRWLLLFPAWLFIGYGIGAGYFRLLGPVLVAVVAGSILLYKLQAGYEHEGAGKRYGPRGYSYDARSSWARIRQWWRDPKQLGLIYSFSRLLPILPLTGFYGSVVLKHPVLRGYFLFHQILGYVLAIYVAAGLSLLGR